MLERRSTASEIMDDPELPDADYRAVLNDLAKVNRLTLAYRPTLAFIDHITASRKRIKILDVGFGQGDMLRAIARHCAKRGVEAELVGIDLNPRSEAIARAVTPATMPIRYQTGDYADLVGGGWDAVISSLVAHHMSQEELLLFLQFMESEARLGWFVNDLHRHAFAYHGYPVLAALADWHEIVRLDGQTSIARSFRRTEWEALLAEADIAGARITRHFPFRLCVGKIH